MIGGISSEKAGHRGGELLIRQIEEVIERDSRQRVESKREIATGSVRIDLSRKIPGNALMLLLNGRDMRDESLLGARGKSKLIGRAIGELLE